jgi:hypothetical protein
MEEADMPKQVVTIQIQVEMPTVQRMDGETYSRYLQRLDDTARRFVKEAMASDNRMKMTDLQVTIR